MSEIGILSIYCYLKSTTVFEHTNKITGIIVFNTRLSKSTTITKVKATVWFFHFLRHMTTLANYHAKVINKKAELSQRWPRDAPYIWVPWKFSGVPDYTHGYFSRKF